LKFRTCERVLHGGLVGLDAKQNVVYSFWFRFIEKRIPPAKSSVETFGQLPWLVRHQPDRNIAIAQVSAEMALEGREGSAEV
jgi:hypothetical protein